MTLRTHRSIALLFGLALVLNPPPALACAVCFGQSDTDVAQGVVWGVLALLLVVVSVLAAIAGFFFHVARRAALLSEGQIPEPTAQTTENYS